MQKFEFFTVIIQNTKRLYFNENVYVLFLSTWLKFSVFLNNNYNLRHNIIKENNSFGNVDILIFVIGPIV